MTEELQKIPEKIHLEHLDTAVLKKDKLDQLLKSGKMPPADAIVDEILLRAVKAGAPDLHLEPAEAGLRIKLGYEGTLRTFVTLPEEIMENVISVMKTKAGLNAFEKKAPQHGRFRITYGSVEFDFRISTLPMDAGERVALQIAERYQKVHRLEEIGFIPENLRKINELLHKPHGMIVISGPTGSGKTTTAYAALNELSLAGKNILTYEDPIEYPLDFASQLNRGREKSIPFSTMVMELLNQHPDVLLCGDVKDPEGAQGAVEAALNGILVLTTMIATDAVGTIFRMADLGIPYIRLASSLNGIVHQRLIRNNCPDCSREYEPGNIPPGIAELDPGRKTFKRGEGCDRCQKTGYQGRSAVREVLVMSDPLRDLLFEQASIGRIKQTALGEGFVNIRTVTADRVLNGSTSIDEYLRVIG
jgi:type II secretory ATPase GspE/PulE/Tfp pilus assembly ATPase PilB-like protein